MMENDGTGTVADRHVGAPPLVLSEECELLRAKLAAVARGESLLLLGDIGPGTAGRVTENVVRAMVETLWQTTVILTHAASLPVVKVGRVAGETPEQRTQAAFTVPALVMNLVRALASANDVSLWQLHERTRSYLADSPARLRYAALAHEMDLALSFVRSSTSARGTLAETFLASPASALTGPAAPLPGGYSCAGHMLWAAEDIEPDSAETDRLAAVRNPIAVRLDGTVPVTRALQFVERLDPDREPGRLTFVVGLGASQVRDVLPLLVEKVKAEGAEVCWVTDPLRGNPAGSVRDEIRGFMQVHRELGSHPGGIDLMSDAVPGATEQTLALDLALTIASEYFGPVR